MRYNMLFILALFVFCKVFKRGPIIMRMDPTKGDGH